MHLTGNHLPDIARVRVLPADRQMIYAATSQRFKRLLMLWVISSAEAGLGR